MKYIYAVAVLGLFISVQGKADSVCVHEIPITNNQKNTISNPVSTLLFNDVNSKVCGRGYAWGFSDKTHVNVYAAEYLTRDQIQKAKGMRRYGTFDNRDPLIQDYRNSGYDRGHMAPSGDMGDYESQVETYVPQNLVPQTKQLNSGKWNWIENQVRQMTIKYGSLYVVSGPYFQGGVKTIGKDHLWVPYATWKAIYIPEIQQAGVYFCKNTKKPVCYIQTVAFFSQHTGIDPFPTLDASIKAKKASLPKLIKNHKKTRLNERE